MTYVRNQKINHIHDSCFTTVDIKQLSTQFHSLTTAYWRAQNTAKHDLYGVGIIKTYRNLSTSKTNMMKISHNH